MPPRSSASIPEMIGEIPGALFVPNTYGAFETPSGNILYHEVTNSCVSFGYRQETDPLCYDLPHFYAAISLHKMGLSLAFSVRNTVNNPLASQGMRLQPGERYPGIHASGLLGASITYFEYVRSKELTYLRGSWEQEDSVNMDQFMHYMNEQIHLPIPQRKSEAAFSTWTGRQALRHGFTTVDVKPMDGRGALRAYFERPQRS